MYRKELFRIMALSTYFKDTEIDEKLTVFDRFTQHCYSS